MIRNALRFAPEGTTVDVKLDRSGASARLVVEDRGPGVPESELSAIFRPFHRVGTDRDRRTGGSGVGLAITRSAFAAHGGAARAENRQGGGLRVELALPLDAARRPERGVGSSIRA